MALIKSPLPGRVLEYKVNEGDKVSRGDVVVIVEAMKMHNEICAENDGTVIKLIVPIDAPISMNGDLAEIN